ncbi:PHP domain-containing protein [Glaciecola siphonariae]|uniref:PHP domain-containing protein n=1 Tax=Glaciecola siphonariae TaxID=521012 RepID=A0ABV9LTT7_9ALTE
MKIDLHSHTNYSDGALRPEELVMRAQQMQLDVLAITDHDTLGGLQEARDYAKVNVPKLNIISGVEISTSWHGFEIHVLGLNVDEHCPKLLSALETQQAKREQRSIQILEKLQKAGVDINIEDVRRLTTGVVSRGHFAQVLVRKGVCSHPQQAFTQYLGKGKKAYVSPGWTDIQSAVSWIKDAKGQAVLAHPYHYDMTTKWLRRLLLEFKAAGGEGLEVQHPNLAKAKHDLMVSLANEYALLGSAGSDFHAPSRWTELGKRLHLPDTIKPVWHNWDMLHADAK